MSPGYDIVYERILGGMSGEIVCTLVLIDLK